MKALSGQNTVLTLNLLSVLNSFSVNLQGCCLLFCCQSPRRPAWGQLVYTTTSFAPLSTSFSRFFQGFLFRSLSCVNLPLSTTTDPFFRRTETRFFAFGSVLFEPDPGYLTLFVRTCFPFSVNGSVQNALRRLKRAEKYGPKSLMPSLGPYLFHIYRAAATPCCRQVRAADRSNQSTLSSPQKKSATVPGPVWLPIVVPTLLMTTLPFSFGNFAST